MKYEKYPFGPEIKRNLARMGFNKTTDIQFKSIPAVLKGEDVLAIAQTGTGKTAAFALPVIHLLQERKLRQNRPDGIKCVVMAPTRELVLQLTEVFEEFARGTRVRVMSIVGGVDQNPQIKKLQDGVDIIVVTPGRMFDLVSQGHIRLHRVEFVILDEADHMLDLGFIKDIQDLLRFLPKNRQTLFFSATINPKIKKLANSLVNNPIRITLSPKDPVSKNVVHSVAYVEMDDKRFFLERLLSEHPEKKVLVFVRTRVRAERVKKAMARVDIEAITIHGEKEQSDRNQVMKKFRSGEVKVLIATDVTARGIDIPSVEYVVNYDLPEQPENYVHRVGRTGRGRDKGRAISFCSDAEREILDNIEGFLGNKINVTEISSKEYMKTVDLTAEPSNDWKSVMKEIEDWEQGPKKKSKKKKKGK